MKGIAFAALSVLAVVSSGCVTPYGPKGAMGGYENYQVGEDEHQIIVSGNGYTDQGTLMQYLHRRATEICGSRGYKTTNTTADTASSVGTFGNSIQTVNRSTVSAIIECKPYRADRPARRAPRPSRAPVAATSGADDGEKPICPPLDPELEKLRPPGYVSPTEGDCVPAARPEPSRRPVVVEDGADEADE